MGLEGPIVPNVEDDVDRRIGHEQDVAEAHGHRHPDGVGVLMRLVTRQHMLDQKHFVQIDRHSENAIFNYRILFFSNFFDVFCQVLITFSLPTSANDRAGRREECE